MGGEAGGKIPVYPILILSILLVYGILPLWAIIALSGWYLFVLYLEDYGYLDRWNFERVLGIVLMIRTSRGRGFLEYISKNRRFWRLFGEFSIWLCCYRHNFFFFSNLFIPLNCLFNAFKSLAILFFAASIALIPLAKGSIKASLKNCN